MISDPGNPGEVYFVDTGSEIRPAIFTGTFSGNNEGTQHPVNVDIVHGGAGQGPGLNKDTTDRPLFVKAAFAAAMQTRHEFFRLAEMVRDLETVPAKTTDLSWPFTEWVQPAFSPFERLINTWMVNPNEYDSLLASHKRNLGQFVSPALNPERFRVHPNDRPEIESLELDRSQLESEGTVTLTGVFSDAEPDRHLVKVDWGDGSPAEEIPFADDSLITLPGEPSPSFSFSHTYSQPVDNNRIVVSVFDDPNGRPVNKSLDVFGTLDVWFDDGAGGSGLYFVGEGSTVELRANVVNEDDFPNLTVEWDLDGDGVYGESETERGDERGKNVIFNADGLDGNSDLTVDVQATSTVHTGNETALITIQDVLAEVSIAASIPNPELDERGQTLTFTAVVDDPSPSDVFSVSWQVEHGALPAEVIATGTGTSLQFTPLQPGHYEVSTFVRDADDNIEDIARYTFEADPLQIDSGGPYFVEEGATLELTGSATIPGALDATLQTLEWDLDADGKFGEAVTVRGDERGQNVTFDATTIDGPVPFGARFRVTTSQGEQVTSTALVQVVNDEPLITIDNAEAGESDGQLSFTVSLSKPVDSRVTATLSTSDDSATMADGDYTALSEHSFFFEAGETSTTVSVPVTDDESIESAETINAVITSVNSGVLLRGYTEPSLQGEVTTFVDDAENVVVSENLAYVVARNAGLQIIDVGDPTAPSQIGALLSLGSVEGIDVVGDYAFLAAGSAGLRIIDVTDPANPTLAATLDTPGTAFSVNVANNRAWIGDASGGAQVVDVSDPLNPTLAGSIPSDGRVTEVEVLGDTAYVLELGFGLKVYDVSTLSAPELLGTANVLEDTLNGGGAFDIAGDYAYVTDGFAGLKVVDVSDSTTPVMVGGSSTGEFAKRLTVVDDRAYLAGGFGNDLQIVDISDPARPTRIGAFNSGRLDAGNGVAVVGNTAYVAFNTTGAEGDGALRILDLSTRATGTIVDNDTPVLSLVDGPSAFEGSGPIEVVARLERPTTDDVIFQIVAIIGESIDVNLETDFELPQSHGHSHGGEEAFEHGHEGDITIPAGETEVTFEVHLRDDAIVEPDERIAVVIGAARTNNMFIPVNEPTAFATIMNDDGPASVSVSDGDLVVTANENFVSNENWTFTSDASNLTITDNNAQPFDLLGNLDGGIGDGTPSVTVPLATFGGLLSVDTRNGNDTLTFAPSFNIGTTRGLDVDTGTGTDTVSWLATTELDSASIAADTISLSSPDFDNVINADVPIAYYRLGESSGTTAMDATGNDRDGIYRGAPSFGHPAAIATTADTAVQFDGVDDHVEVDAPSSAALNGLNADFTIEAWIINENSTTNHSTARIVSAEQNQGYYFGIGTNNGLQFTARGIKDYQSSAIVPQDGEFHHVAVCFDSSFDAHFYLDGQLIDTVVGTAAVNNTSVGLFNIGRRPGASAGDGSHFEGAIDEVAIYGTALTADQILTHFRAAGGGGLRTSGTGSVRLTADRNIVVNPGFQIATEDGDVTLDANVGGNVTGTFQAIYFNDASVTSTHGSISMSGAGGDIGNANRGIRISGGSTVSTGSDGMITLNGTGRGSNGNDGVLIDGAGSTVRTVDGDISVVGTGRGTGPATAGVHLLNGGAVEAIGDGDVSIIGTGGGNAIGVQLNASSSTVGSASGTGDISITTDELNINVAAAVQGSGHLAIQPYSPNAAVNLGASATDTGLQITDVELGRISDGFASITIGDTANGSGAIDVNASIFTDPVSIVGGSISVTGLYAENNAVTLRARTGAIIDGGTDGDTDLTAGSLAAYATAGVGSSDNSLDTTVDMLEADGGTGSVNIANTGNVIIGGVSDGLAGLHSIDAGISVSATSDITVAEPIASGDADISLLATENLVIGTDVTAADAGKITIEAGGSATINSGATVSTVNGDVSVVANASNEASGTFTGIIVSGANVTSSGGQIKLRGFGGNSGNGNKGVSIVSGSTITTDGGIDIDGVGHTAGNSNHGVFIDGATTRIGTGDSAIQITGTGRGTGTATAGVAIANGATVEATGAGDVEVTGTPVDAAAGISLGGTLGASTGTGKLRIVTDNLLVNSSSVIQGAGTLAIEPKTATTSIGLGGGGGTLNVSDTELATLADGFSSITIGNILEGTGDVDIDTVTFTAPVTIAGGTIQDRAGIDVTAPEVTLQGTVAPGQSPGTLRVDGDVNFVSDATVLIEVGGLTAGTQYDQVSVSGDNRTIDLGGSMLDVRLADEFAPVDGGRDVFRIVDSNGAGAVVNGAFTNAGGELLNSGDTFDIGDTTFRIEYNPAGSPGDVILIEQANRSPSIAVGDLAYTEDEYGTNFVQIDPAATLADDDGDADWDGGTLNVQITANAENDDQIVIASNVAGAINVTKTGVHNGSTLIGTFSTSPGSGFTVTFNENATNAFVQDVVRAVSYRTLSDAPSELDRTVTFTATDRNGSSDSDTAVISVASTNDPATVRFGKAATTALAEDTDTSSAIKLADVLVSDPDGGENVLSLGGDDEEFFNLVGAELFLLADTVLDFDAKPFYSLTVSVDDETVPGSPDDTAPFTLNVENVQDSIVIVENKDTEFATTGSWTSQSNKPNVLDGDFLFTTGGEGDRTATWSQDLEAGQYRVSASYRNFSNRATNVPFTIRDTGIDLTTVLVNQQQKAVDVTEDGVGFHDLGIFNIAGGTLEVAATNNANGIVAVDAIRIEHLGPVIEGPEVQVSVDGGVLTDGTSTIDFGDVEDDQTVSKLFTVTNLGTTNLQLPSSVNVPSGFILSSDFSATTLAPLNSATFEVTVDTVNLGLQAGEVSFANNGVDDIENPFNFTVRANVIPDTGIQIVDNGDAGYSTVGNWVSVTGNGKGHKNDFDYANSGTGANTASWTFTVTPGQYQVAASWKAHANRSDAAPFTIFNDGFEVLTTTANQTVAAAGIDDAGASFASLGMFNISGTTLKVTLSDDTPGLVSADAVRIERVGDIPVGPEILVTDAGSEVTAGSGTVDFGDIETGDSATRTLRVYNFGTENLTLDNDVFVSPGFSAGNFGTTVVVPNASTTLELTMDTSSITSRNGTVSFNNNDSDEGPFSFSVQGNVTPVSTVQVLDNGSAGFSTTGSWTHLYTPNGHQADFHFAYGAATENATARWQFDIDQPGDYRVSVHWRHHSNRATDARFSLNDLASSSVQKNQQLAPTLSNGTKEGGSVFEHLGVFTFSGSKVEVSLSNLTNDAGTIVVADAVRIERVGNGI